MTRGFALALTFALTAPADAGTSNSLMDVSPDGKRMLVANADSGTVSIIDLVTRTKIAELPAGDHPEGTAWVGSSPVGIVTVYGDNRVLFLDADAKKISHILPVSYEPYGVVVTKDGKFAYVSHDYPGSVSEIDIAAKKVTRIIRVGENCRGLALAADEKMLYVTEFLTAKLIAVDLAAGCVSESWAGYESDNLCRNVIVHPTRPKAYLPHLRSRVTSHDARGSIFPQVSFCDLVPRKDGEKRRRSISLDTYNGVYVVTNPWEMALSPDGKTMYSVYAGTNDGNISRIIDDDYQEAEAIGRAVQLGKHPRAVRVSPDGKTVYVYNTLDHAVTIHEANFRTKLGSIMVATPAHTEEWRRGKELFQTALQPMGNARWIACSSCHPDGYSDGRVWQNPEGPRRTPHLFGLAHTHPIHWSADRDEVQDFEYTIRGKLMRGRGLYEGTIKPRSSFLEAAELDEHLSGKSKDLDALAIYTNSFPFRLSPHKLSAEAERGKTIFQSAKAQCASCHSGPYFTDSALTMPHKLHDVGTGGTMATEKMGPKFDTPTLLGVYRTGPYLHDGRAKTLKDVLTQNPGDQHGVTSHLTSMEVEELVAFLKALPYEEPPVEVPNTVKERVILKYPRPKVE